MDGRPALPEKRIVPEFGDDVAVLILDSVTADESRRRLIRAVRRMTRGGEVGGRGRKGRSATRTVRADGRADGFRAADRGEALPGRLRSLRG
ncbi:MAG TPA: hypothetical protein VF170_03800 [Planctomycetaceae bacterium]